MSKATVKSGKEVLEGFFKKIDDIEGVDADTAKAVLEQYQAGKLTAKSLSNALATQRDKGGKNENQ